MIDSCSFENFSLTLNVHLGLLFFAPASSQTNHLLSPFPHPSDNPISCADDWNVNDARSHDGTCLHRTAPSNPRSSSSAGWMFCFPLRCDHNPSWSEKCAGFCLHCARAMMTFAVICFAKICGRIVRFMITSDVCGNMQQSFCRLTERYGS